MTSKFEMFFKEPYDLIKSVLKANLSDRIRIVDIGCGVGNLEDFISGQIDGAEITAVDIGSELVRRLKERQYKNMKVNAVCMDGTEYLHNNIVTDADLLLFSASLHEINDPKDQVGYLKTLFNQARRMLGKDGKVVIGDYYYPDSLPQQDVDRFIEYQKTAINHADAREKFINPEVLKSEAQKAGFEIVQYKEIRAVKEIDRRYYAIALKKRE